MNGAMPPQTIFLNTGLKFIPQILCSMPEQESQAHVLRVIPHHTGSRTRTTMEKMAMEKTEGKQADSGPRMCPSCVNAGCDGQICVPWTCSSVGGEKKEEGSEED